MKRNQKGFTLAELLIVVAIVGVLVAVAVPVFVAQETKAKNTVTAKNRNSSSLIPKRRPDLLKTAQISEKEKKEYGMFS